MVLTMHPSYRICSTFSPKSSFYVRNVKILKLLWLVLIQAVKSPVFIYYKCRFEDILFIRAVKLIKFFIIYYPLEINTHKNHGCNVLVSIDDIKIGSNRYGLVILRFEIL